MWISPDGCHANWFCWDAGSSEIMMMILFQIWRKIPLTFTKCYSKVYGKVTMAKTQFHIPENKIPSESHSKLHGTQNMPTMLKILSENVFNIVSKHDKHVVMYTVKR
jgi:hypothetical protein